MTDRFPVIPRRAMLGSLLLGLASLSLSGCVIAPEPHEGYYDHEHHRWYHEHQWRECGEHDWGDHCRR